jgi:ABC-type antimicrobial peptide transport system permease subunit
MVRGEADPRRLTNAILAELRQLDRDQPAVELRTMAEVLAEVLSYRQLASFILSLFALFAVILAAVGIHGLIASSVAQRTREFGIRMALGARAADVLRDVLREGAVVTGVGVAVGMAGAIALARAMAGVLYGVRAGDPAALVAVPLLLAGVAMLASFVPARRATKVDPVVALKGE